MHRIVYAQSVRNYRDLTTMVYCTDGQFHRDDSSPRIRLYRSAAGAARALSRLRDIGYGAAAVELCA